MLVRTIAAGDLVIENGHFVIARGARYVRQKIACRFKFFLGEWFLDLREGIPYFRDVFTWDPNLAVIRSLFRRVVVTTPGVLALVRFDLKVDTSTRRLTFTFQARCSDGDIVVGPDDDDFLLDLPA